MAKIGFLKRKDNIWYIGTKYKDKVWSEFMLIGEVFKCCEDELLVLENKVIKYGSEIEIKIKNMETYQDIEQQERDKQAKQEILLRDHAISFLKFSKSLYKEDKDYVRNFMLVMNRLPTPEEEYDEFLKRKGNA